MHIPSLAATLVLSLVGTCAYADNTLRGLLSSGATLGSSYTSSSDHKIVTAEREDAGSFVASDGAIRGAYLEAALARARKAAPQLLASDMDIAKTILIQDELGAASQVQP